jgi:hypothetical protein
MTIRYEYRPGSLYLNVTNACSNACTFCVRQASVRDVNCSSSLGESSCRKAPEQRPECLCPPLSLLVAMRQPCCPYSQNLEILGQPQQVAQEVDSGLRPAQQA